MESELESPSLSELILPLQYFHPPQPLASAIPSLAPSSSLARTVHQLIKNAIRILCTSHYFVNLLFQLRISAEHFLMIFRLIAFAASAGRI